MSWLFAQRLRPFVLMAAGASLILNLVLLIPSIYMLQVFDRVFSSRSNETLVMLSALAFIALVLGYFADSVRADALGWAGRTLDRYLSPLALESSLQRAAVNAGRGEGDAMRDIGQLRSFLNSPGVLALFDAPWLPLYLLIIALMHPLLGLCATLGATLLLSLAVMTERLTRKHAESALNCGRAVTDYVQAITRNSEVIVGMRMQPAALDGWRERHLQLALAQERYRHRSTRLSALARMSRQALQIVMLALGAGLVIDAQSSPGIMIAATILLGRALQPVEQLISGWKAMIDARSAWARLSERPAPSASPKTALPTPNGKLELERVVYTQSPGKPSFIKGISLRIEAGESVGIIGPSACGKTTLIRLMLGILQPHAGAVRLDGADIHQWDRAALGTYLGYVPQDLELFAGTIAENIARLEKSADVDSARVVEAAQLAHAHEMIVRMPDGYETQIGQAGAALSGGQRQRIALARALYGNPRLVILDEPNANLDADGEIALANTLRQLRLRGTTVVMVGHNYSLMLQLDKLAILKDGALESFGASSALLSGTRAEVRQLRTPVTHTPTRAGVPA